MNNNSEIAKIVIGKILLKPEYYFYNQQLLNKYLFLDYVDRGVFVKIKEKLDKSLPVDEVVLLSETNDPNLIDRITQYSEAGYTRTDFVNCLEILGEDAKKNSLKLLGADIVSKSNNGKTSDEIIEEVQERLSKINLSTKSDLANPIDQLTEFMNDVVTRMESDGPIGVPSGISQVDKFTNCWQNGELIIIAARPSMGKTAIATNMALNSALRDYPSAIFSYEMGYKQIYARIVSTMTGVNNKWITAGAFSSEDKKLIDQATDRLSNTPLYIEDCGDSSLQYLSSKIRQHVTKNKVRIVYVDYLQLISNRMYSKSREQEISSYVFISSRILWNISRCRWQ